MCPKQLRIIHESDWYYGAEVGAGSVFFIIGHLGAKEGRKRKPV
jgi:hypothetical protein